MDSYRLNEMNTFLNFISGNCFPNFKSNNDNYSIKVKCYSVLTWIAMIIYGSIVIGGTFLVSLEIALKQNTVCITVLTDVTITGISIYIRSHLLKKIIIKMQEISIAADRNELTKVISRISDPISKLIKICVSSNLTTSTVYNLSVLIKLFNQNQFTYTDFAIAVYFPTEPFDKILFTIFTLLHTTTSLYVMLKKEAINTMVIHAILLITSHYKYLKNELADIFASGGTDQEQEGDEMNLKDRLRKWIKHHQSVSEINRMWKNFTAVNVLIIYVNNTFIFCFLAIMIIKVPSDSFTKYLLAMFGVGNLIQLYMICYSAQELLDASASVSTKAFHIKWFTLSKSSKKTFNIIMLADNFENRLSAFGMVDLSLSTFTEIVQHAYSACLILVNVR